MLETIKNNFEKTFMSSNKKLETASTKAIHKASEKAMHQWRELVELANREKALPDSFVIARLATDIGIHEQEASALFQNDVAAFGKRERAAASLERCKQRVNEHLRNWDCDTTGELESKRRVERERIMQQLRDFDQESRYITRDITSKAGAEVDIKRNSNSRLLPVGESVLKKGKDHE